MCVCVCIKDHKENIAQRQCMRCVCICTICVYMSTALQSGPVTVARVVVRQQQRHPGAPFTTSTLQQEASRRLGFSAARTMRVAQQLYEGAGVCACGWVWAQVCVCG